MDTDADTMCFDIILQETWVGIKTPLQWIDGVRVRYDIETVWFWYQNIKEKI